MEGGERRRIGGEVLEFEEGGKEKGCGRFRGGIGVVRGCRYEDVVKRLLSLN